MKPIIQKFDDLPDQQEPIFGKWLRPGEVVMLFGDAGSQKTYISLCIAYAISTGQEFLGMQAKRRTVLYIDGEMGDDLTRRLLNLESSDMFESGLTDNFYSISPKDCPGEVIYNIATYEGQRALDKLINDSKADVIFIDNLTVCAQNTSDLRNDFDKWDMIQPWLIRHKNAGKTIILLHHTNKGGRDQSGGKAKEVIINYNIRIAKSRLVPALGKRGIVFEFLKRRESGEVEAPDLLIGASMYEKDGIKYPSYEYETLKQAQGREIRKLLDEGYPSAHIAAKLELDKWMVDEIKKTKEMIKW